MAKSDLKSKKSTNFTLRSRRVFSDAFKREKVAEIVSGQTTILKLSKLWGVSKSSIYLWVYKFSPTHQKGSTMVVQKDSEATKVLELQAQIANLERVLGQKQLAIDFSEKLIEIASKELEIDIKKTFSQKL